MTAGAIAAPRSGIASAKQFGIAGVVFAAVAWEERLLGLS